MTGEQAATDTETRFDLFEPVLLPAEQNSDEEITFCFLGNELLTNPDDGLPSPEAIAGLGPPLHHFIISRSRNSFYGIRVWSADRPCPPDLVKANFRRLWANWPQPLQEAGGRAQQLATWFIETRFCGVCGGAMETDLHSKGRRCPQCGHVTYPRISPVGIVLVTREDHVLLARSPHFPPGIYSALAGYVEAGESLEACLRREVREEVGIEIKNIQWFGNQLWPQTSALMLGCTAEYAGGSLRLQEEEIEDARWFPRDALPELPHPASIAYRMLQAWLAQESE